MIDVRALRENPEPARASQRARGADPALVDRAIETDEARRAALTAFESRRAEHKAFSQSIGKASPAERPAIIAAAGAMAAEVKSLESAAKVAEAAASEALLAIENIVIDGVPAGGEENFEVLKHVGEPPSFDFPIQDHLAIAEGLKAIDTGRGTKVSGTRFYYLTGIGALLEQALLLLARDRAMAAGFTPITTPTLVSPGIMKGTGFLGEHADEIYYLPADDLYLTGTSEVAIAGFHMDEFLDLNDGPLRYAGMSTCYRREAGSYGRDTRGIIRVHQFNKVELFSFVRQEEAEAEHQRLLAIEEELLRAAELPYRVIDVAAGDLGSSAARKYDCEAWLPTQERYLELTSTSNCTTFQARRLQIREKLDGVTRPVATLNGTAATTRWLVAMLENHQQPDGSVHVPAALRPYLGGREVLAP
ncbi:MAG: serine--tRNA ligase [Ruaniaceae bacterium]|nr:serine--tRNA ligase [Ruaniaceae bacterium]